MRAGLVVSTCLLLLAGAMLWEAVGMSWRAGQVPILILIPTVLALVVQWLWDLRRPAEAAAQLLSRREVVACVVVGSVVLASELLGLALGVSLCLMAILTLRAGVPTLPAAAAAALTFFAIDKVVGDVLGRLLPEGWLWGWLGL